MSEFSPDRRTVLRGIAATGGFTALPARGAGRPVDPGTTDPHTRATFAAAVDAIVPETPELESELGPEHVPGALETGVHDYMVHYVNELFAAGSPVSQEPNLRLAELVAALLDAAAAEAVARGEATPDPAVLTDLLSRIGEPADALGDPETLVADLRRGDVTGALGLGETAGGGTFALLAPEGRLRALSMFDDRELDTAELPGPLVEADLGLIPTLVVGFSEVIYYSEWEGYEDITRPPSEREHANDPTAVQAWRQTGYPGFADGYAAYRGYWGAADSSLGAGETWRDHEFDAGTRSLTFESGSFRDNEYDTSDYEEVFPDDDSGDGDTPIDEVVGGVTGDGPPGSGVPDGDEDGAGDGPLGPVDGTLLGGED